MKYIKIILVSFIAISAQFAAAEDAGTIYTQLGTNGFGLGYAKSVSESWALRGQYNTYQRTYSGDISDVGSTGTLVANLKLNSVQMLGDWYPGDESGFHLTGGLVINNNQVTLDGVGSVNGKAATVNGTIKLSKSPSLYLGIGYATRPKSAKGFGFNLDLGMMSQNPDVDLSATGTGVTQSDVDAQKAKINDSISVLRTMPVLAFGISYSF